MISARPFVPAGGSVQLRGGETSEPSHHIVIIAVLVIVCEDPLVAPAQVVVERGRLTVPVPAVTSEAYPVP